MSYKLNKTDGTILTDLVDGTVDNTSSDLTLIGRNYSGFGEFLNENFIKLLENFSSADEPSNPIRGQLWYDTSENKLKIYKKKRKIVSISDAQSQFDKKTQKKRESMLEVPEAKRR